MKNELKCRMSVITILIIALLYFYPKYDILVEYITQSVVFLYSLYFKIEPVYYGNTIFLNFDTIILLTVSPECSGLIVIFIFLFVVWMIPKVSIQHRLIGSLLIIVILLGNVFRLFIDILVGNTFNVDILRIYHSTISQLFILVILCGCFIIFMKISKSEQLVNK